MRIASTKFSIALMISLQAGRIAAADIKVVSADVFTGVLDGIAEEFTRASGHKVSIDYHTVMQVKRRIQAGEFADVTILNRPQIEDLLLQKKVAANSAVDFARSGVGMAVRAGAPKPAIGTVEALRDTLLAAKSISYPNPARGGLSGNHLQRVFERLGITEEMRRKTKFPPPGQFTPALIANGEVELGMTQPMEFYAEPRVQFAGWLPAELQNPAEFSFAAAIPAVSKETQAAAAFIRFLAGPSASAVFRAKGMEPTISERKPSKP